VIACPEETERAPAEWGRGRDAVWEPARREEGGHRRIAAMDLFEGVPGLVRKTRRRPPSGEARQYGMCCFRGLNAFPGNDEAGRERYRPQEQIVKEVKIMPGGDRTGPVGRGPMTGRGAGFCAGYGVPGYVNPGYGAGGAFFGGRGGRGRRNRFFASGVPGWRYFREPMPGAPPSAQPETPQDEWNALKEQARYLEQGLKELQARMEHLASSNRTE